MGNIDDAVLFFGQGFNKIYPLIMVIYTLLVASNFFDRVIIFFGSWKRFTFQNEAVDMDGFDPSGIIILKKERSWLEQGSNVGEHVIPLARNFNDSSMDIETGRDDSMFLQDKNIVEMKATTSIVKDSGKGSQSKPSKEVTRKYATSREDMGNKYAALREQQSRTTPNTKPTEKNIASTTVSLLKASASPSGSSSGIASTWASMKTGFQSFKAKIGDKKFLPISQAQEATFSSRVSSSESLDDIFQRLKKQPVVSHGDSSDEDDTNVDLDFAATR